MNTIPYFNFILIILTCTMAHAQNPFTAHHAITAKAPENIFISTWRSQNITIDVKKAGDDKVTGIIKFNGKNYPFHGTKNKNSVHGQFLHGKEHYPFTLTATLNKEKIHFQTDNFVDILEKFAIPPQIVTTLEKDMLWIAPSCYDMGSNELNNEKPIHQVCLDGFYLGKYEVTQAQWQTLMNNNPSHFKDCGPTCPVERVSWQDTQQFIKKLNQISHQYTYRLPTEAEWEYACRSGGRNQKFSGSDVIDNIAWYEGNANGKTHPVGTKQPNHLGIYDMSGNVWEWVQDWYIEDAYRQHKRNNPVNLTIGANHVHRGGSWDSYASYARCRNRYVIAPGIRNIYLGFRLASTKKTN